VTVFFHVLLQRWSQEAEW